MRPPGSPDPEPILLPVSRPERYELNLGYACNNSCLFCSEAGHRRSAGSAVVPYEDLIRQIETWRDLGGRHLTFLGGEPTLRPDFYRLVAHARRIGYTHLWLTTNGRMLSDPSRLKALILSGLSRLILSLHGPDAETHDLLVRRPGAFDQVRRTIDHLHWMDFPFGISSVLVRPNLPRWPEMMDRLWALGPRRMVWALVRPAGAALERFDALVPTLTELEGPLNDALAGARRIGARLTVAHVPPCRLAAHLDRIDEWYWTTGAVARIVDKPVEAGRPAGGFILSGHFKQTGSRCIACRFHPVCDGVFTEYARRRGLSELNPVPGEPVTDPRPFCSPDLLEDSDGR